MKDELLDRRHRKIGVKIRDIYNKTKNVTKTAKLILDVMKDIRNERTPEWSTSLYSIVMLHTSGLFNFFVEPSSYEVLGSVWDGYRSKNFYKMKDWWFLFYPDLPLINSMALSSRSNFMARLGGLTSGKALCLHALEDEALEWIKTDVPEAFSSVVTPGWKQGIPTARMTLESQVGTGDQILINEEINRKYPEGSMITEDNMNFSGDDIFQGYLTNLKDDDPLDVEISEKNLITKHFGKKSTFY